MIKPSGVSYRRMTLDDLVVLDLAGNRVAGQLRPSSDTATHLVLYRRYRARRGWCIPTPPMPPPGLRGTAN